MSNELRNRNVPIMGAIIASLVLVGCQTTATPVSGVPTGNNLYTAKTKPVGADAGVPLSDPMSKVTVQQIAAGMSLGHRKDPFALLASEVKFDRLQRTERLLNEAGGYVNLFTPTEDPEFAPKPLAPRPLWRVSGVVVSENGIVALLDMGGGRSIVIRPGTLIEGSPFQVDSLNLDRAVLRRLDGQEPKYVTIELSGPLGGPIQTTPTGVPAGAPGAGNRGGGRPPAGGSAGDGNAD